MKRLLLICVLGLFTFLLNGQESCLKSAWEAYNRREWSAAITYAEDCVFTFGPQATAMQNQLAAKNYILPNNFNVGGAMSSQQKDEIFSHGLLNDVCVSYWIIGMSNLRLRNTVNANSAFRNAARLSYALCYNTENNLFWSPSQDAAARLNQ